MRFFSYLSTALLASLFLATAALAQAPLIKEVRVEGAQRVEADTVRSYMLLKKGDTLDPMRADKSLKSLFSTGLFADVNFKWQDGALIVTVLENPVINQVVFEGNNRILDKILEKEVQLKPRAIYTRAKVQEDVQRLIEVYRRTGRFAVVVEPKIIQRPQNRIDLVFEVDEGPTTYIRRITFIGNRKFSDTSLREQIATKEERWYRVFTVADTYDPDRLTYDRELLRRFYLKKGYADFRIKSAVAELTPDREGFYVTFTVDEGKRYKVGKVGVKTHLPELPESFLTPEVTFKTGEWYNADEIENSIQKVTDTAGIKGFAFVDVVPDLTKKGEEGIIDISLVVREGPRVFIDRIDIAGNSRTLDKVIRREFRLAEGDAFNTAKIRRSKQQIQNLGFFGKVNVTPKQSPTAPDRTVLKVDVEEQSTGELSFGVGFSTSEGALIEAAVRERNLLGKGQDLQLAASLAQKKTEVDLSFTEPYFLGRELSAGFDIFSSSRDLQSQSSYDWSSFGESFRLGYRLGEELTQSLKYTIRRDKVSNVADDASDYVKEQRGNRLLSMVSQTLLHDTRDSRLTPTEGTFSRYRLDLAGLGGDVRFLKNGLEFGRYWPIKDNWTLAAGSTLGFITGLDKDVGINYRYYLGGKTLRGFESGGVGARDRETKDALGGNWMASGTAQLSFPIGLPGEFGINGKLFSDVGMIGKPDDVNDDEIFYDPSPRLTLGGGILWRSPMGPINIDLATALLKEEYDQTESFRLDFGTRF